MTKCLTEKELKKKVKEIKPSRDDEAGELLDLLLESTSDIHWSVSSIMTTYILMELFSMLSDKDFKMIKEQFPRILINNKSQALETVIEDCITSHDELMDSLD